MKEWATDNSNTTSSTVELGSSLVCIAEVSQNLSNASRAREDEIILESRIAEADEYKGIGNMVRETDQKWHFICSSAGGYLSACLGASGVHKDSHVSLDVSRGKFTFKLNM